MKGVVVSASLLVLVACGGEASNGAGSAKSSASSTAKDEKKDEKVASCASESLKNCRQYSGVNLAAGTDSLKQLCESSKAVASDITWKEAACPTAKVIASCDMKMHVDYYYEGAESLESTEKFCKDGSGTWVKK